MSFIIPERKLSSLFGTAYPKLNLITYIKSRLLKEHMKHQIHDCVYVSADDVTKSWLFFIYKYTVFDVSFNDVRGINRTEKYKIMGNTESWIAGLKPARSKWFSGWHKPSPTRMFCIDDIPFYEIVEWITTQDINPKEFRIFTRYNDDTSIVFTTDDTASLFKMTFADRV